MQVVSKQHEELVLHIAGTEAVIEEFAKVQPCMSSLTF